MPGSRIGLTAITSVVLEGGGGGLLAPPKWISLSAAAREWMSELRAVVIADLP